MLNKCNPNRSMSLSGYQKTEEGFSKDFSKKVTEEIFFSSTETRLILEYIRLIDAHTRNPEPFCLRTLSSHPDGDFLTVHPCEFGSYFDGIPCWDFPDKSATIEIISAMIDKLNLWYGDMNELCIVFYEKVSADEMESSHQERENLTRFVGILSAHGSRI